MNRYFSLLLVAVFVNVCWAQTSYVKVNNDSISLQDFKHLYKKNIAAEGWEKSVEAYVDFTLLQQAAIRKQADTTQYFIKYLEQSIPAIKEEYTIDQELKEQLIQTSFERMQEDREVEIYTLVPRSVAQSQAAKEDILAQRERMCHSAKTKLAGAFKEQYTINAGWLRGLDLPYELENTVYNTTPGTCSEVKEFGQGFYFVRVLNKRPALGVVYLSVIANQDKNQIEQAYQALQKGEKFAEVVAQYSTEPHTKKKKGNMPPQKGALITDFYNAIKNLKFKEYSQPFVHDGVGYILQLNYAEKCKKTSSCSDWIEQQINTSDRKALLLEKMHKKATDLVEVKENKKALDAVVKIAGDDFFTKKDSLIFKENQKIFYTEDFSFGQQDLVRELLLSKKVFKGKSVQLQQFLDLYIPIWKRDLAIKSYTYKLEKYNEDYKREVDFLKNALRANYFIEKYMYSAAEKDSIGMQKYLEENQSEYMWQKRYELDIVRYEKEEDAAEITKLLKKKNGKEKILEKYKGELVGNKLRVNVTSGKFTTTDKDLGKNFDPNKKIQKTTFRNKSAIVKLVKKLPVSPMNLREAYKLIKEPYQQYFYKETIKELRKNATIIIPKTFNP